jgi:transcriptional regulator of acetoin/glycerol metabolism
MDWESLSGLEDGGNDNRHADGVAKSWSRCCQHGASSDPVAAHAIIGQ